MHIGNKSKMRKLTLGIVIDQSLFQGGGFQASISDSLDLLTQMTREKLIFFTTKKKNISILEDYNIQAIYLNIGIINSIKSKLRRQITSNYLFKIISKFEHYSPFETAIKKYNVDIVYFLSPSSLALDLDSTNFILRVWDIAHLDHPEFPEVRNFREFEARDNLYKRTLKKATAIVADSEIGKENIINKYNIDKSRIYIRGLSIQSELIKNKSMFEASSLDVKKRFNIKSPYLFYPAQFWPHKNHIYILEGLKILNYKYNINVSAVFTGSDKGNLSYIKDYAGNLNLEDRIIYPGFVNSEELYKLYKGCIALVMPTYFGPTNIPPLEAFFMGVPVLYSDLCGPKSQVEDASILINLMDPHSMADSIKSLLEDQELRNSFIAKGYKKLKESEKLNEINYIKEIIDRYKLKRLTWK